MLYPHLVYHPSSSAGARWRFFRVRHFGPVVHPLIPARARHIHLGGRHLPARPVGQGCPLARSTPHLEYIRPLVRPIPQVRTLLYFGRQGYVTGHHGSPNGRAHVCRPASPRPCCPGHDNCHRPTFLNFAPYHVFSPNEANRRLKRRVTF